PVQLFFVVFGFCLSPLEPAAVDHFVNRRPMMSPEVIARRIKPVLEASERNGLLPLARPSMRCFGNRRNQPR
ncbi:MAG TPA: hypothetical protein VIH17_07185, partial [Candidatus Acidoferrales bacterium]